VRPFVEQLAIGFGQFHFGSGPTDFGKIKLVAAANCFVVHHRKESRNGGGGLCVRAKPAELRMMFVTLRFPAQDFLRQERFAPEGH
jgi:hypothetical protein